MARAGRRRAVALGRPRPAVPHRLRGDAARAAHDAGAAARRRRHAGRPPARGAAGRRAAGRVRAPARGARPRIRPRSSPSSPPVAHDRGDRRPDVGPVPGRAAAAAAGRRLPPGRRRRRSAADGEGRSRDRRAAPPPAPPSTAIAAELQAGGSRSSAAPRPRCRPDLVGADPRRGPPARSTSRSSPPARTPPARTTTPADRVIARGRDRAVRLRRHDERLLLRHHPLRVHRRRQSPNPELADAYAVLHEAQQAACAAATVGVAVRGRRSRRPARSSPTPASATTSSTAPVTASAWRSTRTRTSSRATHRPLAAGHAFSIEPGIYVPGRWGMRLEDIVVASDRGPIAMNRVEHRLVNV